MWEHVAHCYLVDVFMILQPGKVHLLHIAGAAGHRWENRRSPGGAASPGFNPAPGRALSTPSQPLTPPDTPTPQHTR